MSKEYQQDLESALSLPQREFIALIQIVLGKVHDRIEGETAESTLPWETDDLLLELDRRVEEVRSGKVKAIAGDEVMERLKKRFL